MIFNFLFKAVFYHSLFQFHQVSKQVGVLRPVNQCGYIRAVSQKNTQKNAATNYNQTNCFNYIHYNYQMMVLIIGFQLVWLIHGSSFKGQFIHHHLKFDIYHVTVNVSDTSALTGKLGALTHNLNTNHVT